MMVWLKPHTLYTQGNNKKLYNLWEVWLPWYVIPLHGLIHRLPRFLASNYGSPNRFVPFLKPLSLPYSNQLANTPRCTTQTPGVCARTGQWFASALSRTFQPLSIAGRGHG